MNTENKIPKIIHYCWFGRGPKPAIVEECIESWKDVLVDYTIIEWNEENFDVNENLYTKEAYEKRKFAFVSDYVRLYALSKFGGIYLDTDVKVYKKFDDLLHHHSFWGFEQENFIATSTIGSRKDNKLINIFFEKYKNTGFLKEDNKSKEITNVILITKIMNDLGIISSGLFQEIKSTATVYPQEYFSPYDYINIRHLNNHNTYAEHYFYKSWVSPKEKLKFQVKKQLANIIGGNTIYKIRNIIKGGK